MNHRFLKYFLGLITHVICISAFAQTELRGSVADFSDYLPIVSANIYIQNTTLGTISNSDGKFVLVAPREFENDTLIISSIGYKSFKVAISHFDNSEVIYLETDIASLDEVLIVAATRPKTGNDIVLKAIEELSENLPEQPYLQKGFLRHRERNRKEYKWLIESAITLYDSSYASGAKDNLRINVDENRKSFDLREVDSLYAYAVYLKYQKKNTDFKSKKLNRDTIETASLIAAIKWNDKRINGLENIFKGRLNLLRNSNVKESLFGEGVLDRHQFDLDTILVDDGRKLYKIRIAESTDFVGLNTKNIYNEGYQANGWLYIYWDTYAIKKIEYELVATSEIQKRRSKSLYGTQINHKLVMTYTEYEGKMYPNYFYYETPKLVNVGNRSSDKVKVDDRDTRFYYTVQEILFTEIIQDPDIISEALQKDWSEDIFLSRAYNKEFWKNYNVLLESEEEEKLIQDLSKRATLFKQ
jgi:hypothetical protein